MLYGASTFVFDDFVVHVQEFGTWSAVQEALYSARQVWRNSADFLGPIQVLGLPKRVEIYNKAGIIG